MTSELIKNTSDLYIRDIQFISSHLEDDDSGYWARSLIKTIVSFYEADIFILKSELVKFCQKKQVNIQPNVLMYLKNMKYDIKDNGDIKEKYYQVTLKADIKFAFKQVCSLKGYILKADYNDSRWSQLVNTIGVRNRLTHPKSLTDQSITKEEIEDCISSYEWFMGNTNFFLTQDAEYYEKIIESKSK
tara:strand:+ start:25 stop:588 length:564 start_codon:yes stop_codon:yes gene_type:complete